MALVSRQNREWTPSMPLHALLTGRWSTHVQKCKCRNTDEVRHPGRWCKAARGHTCWILRHSCSLSQAGRKGFPSRVFQAVRGSWHWKVRTTLWVLLVLRQKKSCTSPQNPDHTDIMAFHLLRTRYDRPIQTTLGNCKCMFVLIDKFSKWIEYMPLVKATSEKAVEFLNQVIPEASQTV